MMRRASILSACLLAVIAAGQSVWAQSEIGTVVSTVGTVEVRRHDAPWQPATLGAAVLLADDLRTGTQSAARLVLRDNSVVELADATEVVVERFATEGRETQGGVRLRLIDGKVRVFMSGSTDQRGRFEVETPTAIAGSRSGSFLVLYDAANAYTDVIGIEGAVDVQGKIGVLESAARVEPRQWTRVAKGSLPTPPAALGVQQLATYTRGLDIVGTGGRDSVDVTSPAMSGRLFQPNDTPAMVASHAGAVGPNGSYLRPTVPLNFVETRSQDMWATQQPIPEYELAPPDVVPPAP